MRLAQHPLVGVLMVLILVGSFAAGNFVYQHMLVAQGDKVASIEAQNYSDTLTREVNRYIKEKRHNIHSFANREAVISAFAQSDRVKVSRLESLVAMLSTDITEGQLLFPNDRRLDQTRNYAAREMFFQAINGEQPPPLAVKLQQGWALLMVYPIVNPTSDMPMGGLIATIDLSSLKDRLANVGTPGSAALVQELPGIAPQTLISTSTDDLSHIKGESATDVPQWKLVFTANKTLATQSAPSTVEVLQLIVFFAISGLLITYLTGRVVYQRFRNDPLPTKQKKPKTAVEKPDATAKSYLQTIPAAATEEIEKPAEETPAAEEKPDRKTAAPASYPEHIFREYDIRGIYNKELTTDLAKQLGRALGDKAQEEGEHSIITALDGRLSSPALCKALEQGIISTGCDVIQIGQVPTPIMNFAVQHIDRTNYGVMVTASHNPADYNGFKITLGNRSLRSEEVLALKERMEQGTFKQGMGEKSTQNVINDYKDAIALDIIPATDLKLVVDAGNGVAGKFAPEIMEKLGCTVIPLYCEVDGSFPNHEADTTRAENLQDLIECVKSENADLGIALDGDGDRVVAVTASGEIVWPDQLMMIFARDIISREPGADIVFDIKSTRRLNALISSYGGRPVMWKTGHSNIRNKTLENNAPLGGEFSGHVFFRDRWHGFDDGIYATARLIEIMTTREQSLEEIVSGFETSYSTPEIKIDVPEQQKFALVEKFAEAVDFGEASVSRIDGIRVDFPDSWGLLRASNTSPALTLRFEASSAQELENVQATFRKRLQDVESTLTF